MRESVTDIYNNNEWEICQRNERKKVTMVLMQLCLCACAPCSVRAKIKLHFYGSVQIAGGGK